MDLERQTCRNHVAVAMEACEVQRHEWPGLGGWECGFYGHSRRTTRVTDRWRQSHQCRRLFNMQFCSRRQDCVWNARRALVCRSLRRTACTENGPGLNTEPRAVATGSLPRHSTNTSLVQKRSRRAYLPATSGWVETWRLSAIG